MENKKKNLFTQVISEYKKIHWASKFRVAEATIVILLITLIIASLVLLFDITFTRLMDNISYFLSKVLK